MNSRVARFAVAAVGVALCCWGIWTSGRAGYSRVLSSQARRGNTSLVLADRAVRFSPSDPKAYYGRGRVFLNTERLAEAIKDFEWAVILRPEDYLSWLQLGYARAGSGDEQGALAAYQEGVRLAPFYGQPRWYLGSLLLRAGRRDEAFAELRLSAASDHKLFPEILNLAWTAYEGDAQAVEQATQPRTSTARLILARFLVEHGNTTKALELFRNSSAFSEPDRYALLSSLLAAKQFTEAYEVWTAGRKSGGSGIATIADGSFESEISLEDPGFGWQLPKDMPTVRVSLDSDQAHTGAFSMRLSWTGDSNPSIPVVSQIVLVEPNTHYRLTWAVRTRELLSIALPVVAIVDPSTDDQLTLKQSEASPRGTSGWQNYAIEFATGETTRAVRILIRREKCETAPCAAIGHAWLDSFSLTNL